MSKFLTTYFDTTQFGTLKATWNADRKRSEPPMIERAGFETIALRRNFIGKDIDEFRSKYGKEEGEAKFFHDYEPDETHIRRFNMFLFNGACSLWQYSLNQGTVTANTALPTPTLLTNANAYLYVSDGGPSAVSGTVSVTNGSGTVTFSTSQTGLLNLNAVITGDSSSQVYTITGGSGTSWTISPVYGGANASGLTLDRKSVV